MRPITRRRRVGRKIFLDVGAWDGISVKLFRKHWKNHEEFEIHSFECNLNLLERLKKEKNINVYDTAAWVYDGTVDFYMAPPEFPYSFTLCSSLIKEKTTGNLDIKNPVKVKCIDFSKWIMDNLSKEDYIILKMDIEGAEWEVLPKMMKDGSMDYIDEFYGEWHVGKVGKTKEDLSVMKENLEKYNLEMRHWCGETDIVDRIPKKAWWER